MKRLLGNSMHLANAVCMLAILLASVSMEAARRKADFTGSVLFFNSNYFVFAKDLPDVNEASLESELRNCFESFLKSSHK